MLQCTHGARSSRTSEARRERLTTSSARGGSVGYDDRVSLDGNRLTYPDRNATVYSRDPLSVRPTEGFRERLRYRSLDTVARDALPAPPYRVDPVASERYVEPRHPYYGSCVQGHGRGGWSRSRDGSFRRIRTRRRYRPWSVVPRRPRAVEWHADPPTCARSHAMGRTGAYTPKASFARHESVLLMSEQSLANAVRGVGRVSSHDLRRRVACRACIYTSVVISTLVHDFFADLPCSMTVSEWSTSS